LVPNKNNTDGSTGGPPNKEQASFIGVMINNDSGRSTPNSLNSQSLSTALACRICLCEAEVDNPLICPCNCAGSMGSIHKNCLKEWLNSKRHVYKGDKVTSYFWKALECELCREPFEKKMRSSLFNIMQFELPNG